MSPTKPETPPVQPSPPPGGRSAPAMVQVTVQAAAPGQQILGPPPPLIPNDNSNRIQQSLPVIISKPNIDLGEVVRSTIINGVTKQFSQVLLLFIYYVKLLKMFSYY